MPAPLPINEAARLKSLHNYAILDTDAEQDFDDLTQLASYICDTPIALISLVDAERQWFKSKVGLDVDETPRDMAFCGYAILQDDIFEVPNALEDPRFVNNELVTGAPDVRFYAGMPLIGPDGQALGSLCVIDQQPRELLPEQHAALRALGRQVVSQLELRRQTRALQQALAAKEQAIEEQMQLQEEVITMQSSALEELTTPLIPISDDIMVMPLIGTVDTRRAQQVLDSLLTGIAKTHASTVILDITGVPVVDTQVANALVQAASAVKLLGAQMTLTGIRPEVAQTLVSLHVNLAGIITHSTLQSGIAFAMNGHRKRTALVA